MNDVGGEQASVDAWCQTNDDPLTEPKYPPPASHLQATLLNFKMKKHQLQYRDGQVGQ